MRSAVRCRSSSSASSASARLLIALVLGRLRLVERGLRFVAPARKLFDLAPVVLDHGERLPLGRVEIADHLVAHHRVEP